MKKRCSSNDCCSSVNRREFVALGGAAMAASALPVMAGPFETNEYLETIPADKKLDPT